MSRLNKAKMPEKGVREDELAGVGVGVPAAVVNPEIFVIGGGVSRADKIVIDYVEPQFQKYAFGPCRSAKLTLAQLGNDAGIYGAAGLVLR